MWWFHEVIPIRVQGRGKLHRCFLIFEPISNEVIPGIDVVIPLATWSFVILLQIDGALIILIDDVIMDLKYLLFQEVSDQEHLC